MLLQPIFERFGRTRLVFDDRLLVIPEIDRQLAALAASEVEAVDIAAVVVGEDDEVRRPFPFALLAWLGRADSR